MPMRRTRSISCSAPRLAYRPRSSLGSDCNRAGPSSAGEISFDPVWGRASLFRVTGLRRSAEDAVWIDRLGPPSDGAGLPIPSRSLFWASADLFWNGEKGEIHECGTVLGVSRLNRPRKLLWVRKRKRVLVGDEGDVAYLGLTEFEYESPRARQPRGRDWQMPHISGRGIRCSSGRSTLVSAIRTPLPLKTWSEKLSKIDAAVSRGKDWAGMRCRGKGPRSRCC